MKQFIILLISSLLTLSSSYADEVKNNSDKNAAANVLNNYYQEFDKDKIRHEKYLIDPDIFLIDSNLNNYYADYLTHPTQKRP